MAATITLGCATPLPGGYVLVTGTATGSSTYLTNGEVLDLSSYILSTSSPIVTCGCSADGYVGAHNAGTATAGKILFYEAGADGAALDEFANAGNAVAVTVPFIAIGQTP